MRKIIKLGAKVIESGLFLKNIMKLEGLINVDEVVATV